MDQPLKSTRGDGVDRVAETPPPPAAAADVTGGTEDDVVMSEVNGVRRPDEERMEDEGPSDPSSLAVVQRSLVAALAAEPTTGRSVGTGS